MVQHCEPLRRTTARVLPVNSCGQVLLLLGKDPANPARPYWFTIGGGVETGETLKEAAVRELLEETGMAIRVEQLTAPFHRETHSFEFNGAHHVSDSTYFAVRLGHATVTFAGLSGEEVDYVLDAGWWAPDDLTASVPLSNQDVPEIARMAVAATHLAD